MSEEAQFLFSAGTIAVIVLALTAVYAMVASRNLVRILLGLEILTKAVTLLVAVAGYVSGRMALAEALIITMIVVEVVIIAVAAGVVINAQRHTRDLDPRTLARLRG